jgi:small-conductance mechanosensitive channel
LTTSSLEKTTAASEDEELAILRGRIQQAQHAVQQHSQLLNSSVAELNRLIEELHGYTKLEESQR